MNVRHVVISFPDEAVATRRQLKKIARKWALRLQRAALVAGVHHQDREHAHLHLIIRD